MRKALVIVGILAFGLIGWQVFSSSGSKTSEPETQAPAKITPSKISAEDAKAILDNDEPFILLDVRTQEEFNAEHIKGAKLLPDYDIQAKAETELPDKNTLIIVYCRSGARSSKAAGLLADLGYTNVRDMGGILDWPFETIKQD